MSNRNFSVAFAGSGTTDTMAAAALLLRGATLAGYYGLISRLAGSHIPDGHSAAWVWLSSRPAETHPQRFDLLCGIDCTDPDRFAAGIPLRRGSIVLYDPKRWALSEEITSAGAACVSVGFAEIAATVYGGRVEIAAASFVGAMLGFPFEALDRAAEALASAGGVTAVATAKAVLRVAFGHGRASQATIRLGLPARGLGRLHLPESETAAPGHDPAATDLEGRRMQTLVEDAELPGRPMQPDPGSPFGP